MRKLPTQGRAKARVEQILDAADALAVERGVANLKTNEIAERAAVPIGSIYQYFGGMEDVLKGLVDRHHRNLEAEIGNRFEAIGSIAEFIQSLRSTMDFCWNYVAENDSYREILFGVQTWEMIREMDWQDTLANAKAMSKAFQPLIPYVPTQKVLAFCIIIWDSGGSMARMALRFDDLRDDLREQFMQMAQSHIFALLRSNAELEQHGNGGSQVQGA